VNNSAAEDFFTRAEHFTVKEIEVFEIADLTAFPADLEKCTNECLFQEKTKNAGGTLSRQPLCAR
jgi:hypothetical protein